MSELLSVGPAAYVKDLAASRRFYEGLLGLEVARVMRRGEREIAVAYTARLSVWQVDDAYDTVFAGARRPQVLGAGNWEFSFETADLDELAARLESAGVRFAQPLRQLPWGQRAIRVYDPDGHIIDIGSLHRLKPA
ncbi:MAG TPA: VOC family protein [Stellaceae bacterium]|nr:VOC family protein [Stellaceae bacterium]